MIASTNIRFSLVLLVWTIYSVSFTVAFRQCSTHPGVQDIKDFQPVLLKNWTKSMRGYFPRNNDYDFVVNKDSTDETVLKDLDVVINNNMGGTFDLSFHREATVYILLECATRKTIDGGTVKAPGENWETMGWYEASIDKPLYTYGMGTEKLEVPASGFVFKSIATSSVSLPSITDIYQEANLVNYKQRGFYGLLLGELDGSPSVAPQNPAGMTNVAITPARHCPKELHDTWAVAAHHDDGHLSGTKFLSWHPVVDPCYACVYNHEHGSDAATLLGDPNLAPAYTYAALKNFKQDESIEGFKSFVFPSGDFTVVYDVHVQTSKARRFQTPIHTGVYTVVDPHASPPKVMARITQKLNFGPLKILDGQSKQLFVNETEHTLHEQTLGHKMPRKRIVNSFESNGYEKWFSAFMCTDDRAHSRQQLAFKLSNPATALENPSDSTENFRAMPLMTKRSSQRFQQPGIERTLVIRNYHVGEEFCVGLTNFTQIASLPGYDGNFFTDPMGMTAYAEPGEFRIHQYIAPGFDHKIGGKHVLKMVDHYETLYGYPGKDGISRNELIWDAIDPTVN